MVQIENFEIKKLWDKTGGLIYKPATLEEVLNVESLISGKFPQSYIDLMLIQDGGYLTKDAFVYFNKNKQEKRWGGIGIMFHLSRKYDYDNMYDFIFNRPEFFGDKLIPFACDGGGNLICFDYTTSFGFDNPTVVFWIHDDPKGRDVHFVADNFNKFLEMLYKSKD
jgi:hypothetical protein